MEKYQVDLEMLGPSGTEQDLERMMGALRERGYSAIAVEAVDPAGPDIPQDVWDECLSEVQKNKN